MSLPENVPRVRGRRFLDRVINRVWKEAQRCDDLEQFELFSVTLRFLGFVKEGQPKAFELAWPWAVGLSMEKYRVRSAERREFWQRELERATPDFDPEEAKRVRLKKNGEVCFADVLEPEMPAQRDSVRQARSDAGGDRTPAVSGSGAQPDRGNRRAA